MSPAGAEPPADYTSYHILRDCSRSGLLNTRCACEILLCTAHHEHRTRAIAKTGTPHLILFNQQRHFNGKNSLLVLRL
jgi:hypothetical protein